MPHFQGLASIDDPSAINADLVKRAHDELNERAVQLK